MNEKVILLVQATVLPEHRDEVVAAAQASLKETLKEAGCEAFFQTVRKDEPNTLVFLEVFANQEAHELHLQQEYTKHVFATMQNKLTGEPIITVLQPL